MSIGHYDDRGGNVCVIGAGASGLLATKNLREHGFGVDCYERDTGVGGLWNWRHHRSPVYATTHLISSRATTEIPDFPMPDRWPDYPHHSQVRSYLERYAAHFDLDRQIWFGTEVVRVMPTADGRWDVTTSSTGGGSAGTHRYAAVVIANGHHWSPRLPDYPGLESFQGEVIHASAFTDPATLHRRRVLVVGAGNTGCDIAVEAAQRAAACWHSSRRGYWYVPKYLLGRPTDQVNALAQGFRVPVWLRRWLFHRVLRWTAGDPSRYGLPKPDHPIYQTHPLINSLLTYYLGHGLVTPVRDVARFHADRVELVSGEIIQPDLVVLATGYAPRFDFLDPQLLGVDEAGRPHLTMHLFSDHPTLAVAGLVQPDAGVFPVVHWQTVALARWLRLHLDAPDRAAPAWSWLRRQAGRRWHDVRVAESPRHWSEVSLGRYLRGLRRLLVTLERAR